MTYKEQLRQVWHQYEQEHGLLPATAREAVQWGVEKGLIVAPRVDPLAKMSEDMATALREEYAVDAHGRRYRVNHAVRVTREGVQHTFWAIIGEAPREHMERAFTQRRDQIVDDCMQLAIDVAAFNALRKDQQPIQMLFDFDGDIERRLKEPEAA